MNPSDGGESPNETRDQLANVRTLLAWVRTGVTIMAFGFVVAKFGLILDQLPGRHHRLGYHLSSILGTSLVTLGAVFLVLATVEYLSIRQAIERGTVRFRPTIYIILSAALVAVALVLAIYLLITA